MDDNLSYSTPTSEYNTILLKMQNSPKTDLYNELLKKEDNVLTTVNRVVNHEQTKVINQELFYNMPLLNIIAIFANTWKNIFIELTVYRDFKNVIGIYEIFTKNDRKIYVGIMLLLVVFFLFMVSMLD